MEFPELGTHCSSPVCSRLDFLPVECDACHQIFCKDHGPYEKHNCEMAYTKDARVPVCPLCDQPVPINRGEDPNIRVDMHMQNECKSEKAKNLSSRCSVQGCKKKELVPVTCNTCRKNFCLKHRFETDHNCKGHPQRLGGTSAPNRGPLRGGIRKGSDVKRKGAPQKTALSEIGAELNRERMMRLQNKPSVQPSTTTAPLQPEMGEDEAMALAIAASLDDGAPHPTPSTSTSSPPSQPPPHSHSHNTAATSIAEDEALARAIAASLNGQDQPKPKPKSTASSSSHGTRNRERNTGNDLCIVL